MATKIKTLCINALRYIDAFFNELARVRDAAHLARMGHHKLAQQLMLTEK
jgi:hypothetical protein